MPILSWFRNLFRAPSAAAPFPSTKIRGTSPVKNEASARLQAAIQHHVSGKLDRAERDYGKLLEEYPDNIGALHLLGRLLAQKGDLNAAVTKLQRAFDLSSEDADICADLAKALQILGDLDHAERLFRLAVTFEPDKAVRHYELSRLLIEKRDHTAAIACLKKTLACEKNHADAHNDLGAAYIEIGDYSSAQRSLEAAVEINPSSPVAYRNLATLFTRLGKPQRATEYFRRALEHAPDDQDVRLELAGALLESGDAVSALDQLQQVAERKPDDASIFVKLADTAEKLNRITEAISWYRRALEIDPRQPEALNDLAILLSRTGAYEEAARTLEMAVSIRPQFDRALDNLGGTYHLQGRYEEAVAAYLKALEIEPLNTVTLSNLIAITNYRAQHDGEFLRGLHAEYRRALSPMRTAAFEEKNDVFKSERRLRVGYVSPDFRRHSVAYFIEPIIAGHDRRRFEVFCYSDVKVPDAKTEAIKGLADRWRDVSDEGDDALASQIRADGIDLLVDLSGHFSGNRLPVFARKPAPVQLSYLGYPATTGLTEIDYRLTDMMVDPPNEADHDYSESLIHLPEVFLCYLPPESAPGVVEKVDRNDCVTFGSFNELPKISPETIDSWCSILKEMPEAKLLLKATALMDRATQQRVVRRFEAAGAAAEQIELIPRTATLAEHLDLYARVDVALDTFPYNGTTTTCEAVLMGVPVITLKGSMHAGRVGASLLNALGLDELVCESQTQYASTAVDLATDVERLIGYRASLRDRLRQSSLCNAGAFVGSLESIYLGLCARQREGGH